VNLQEGKQYLIPEGQSLQQKEKWVLGITMKLMKGNIPPQQISAFILQKIKKDAEEFLGEKVDKVVITVPAYFDDSQRQATKDAGQIAGLEVIRLVNEPTAASLAYGIEKQKEELKILVFDFGGGTLDVTIMDFGDGVFEVKSTLGDTNLGGTDMDNALMKYITDEFKKDMGIDLNEDDTALQRVREAAEKAKIELSTTLETDINLPFISSTNKGPKHLNMKISKSTLEKIVDPIIQKCKNPVEQAFKDANLTKDDIDKIILVGGPTRMPIVQKFVEDLIGKKVERGIDPMECVAQGAAIQAGVLAGEVKNILLLDVTPLSLGIETLGGVLIKLIERNTTIPTKKSKIFSTAEDNQPAVSVRVFQGERTIAADNKLLGQFDLVGIPPALRGIPQIEVAFDIDANGLVNVSAKDLGTNKEQSIKITASQKLSDEEVEKMRNEAKQFADQDKKRKEEIETINQVDTLVYTSEKLLKEIKGKVEDKKIGEIKEHIEELKNLLKEEQKDVTKIKQKMGEMNKIVQEASTELYREVAKEQQKQQEQAKTEVKKNTKDEKIVDADYEVKDDKDKK